MEGEREGGRVRERRGETDVLVFLSRRGLHFSFNLFLKMANAK